MNLRRSLLTAAWTSSALSLAMAACGGTTSAGGTGATSDVNGFADQYCAALEPCCADAGLSTTGTSCHALITLLAGATQYDAAKGAACIQTIQQASGQPGFCTTFGGASASAACNGVFSGLEGGASASTGSTQPGQACTFSTDCAPAPGGGAECISTGGATSICVQTTDGKAGDSPCVATVSGSTTSFTFSTGTVPSPAYVCNVADGVSCSQTTNACAPLAQVGQSCSSDLDCAQTAYCSFGAATSGPQCAPRLADGASCAASLSGCMATSACDVTTMTCKPLSPDGSPCADASTCQSSVCENGTCGTSSNNQLGLALICGT